MIKFITHPAISQVLEYSGGIMKYHLTTPDAFLISDFGIPNIKKIHGGLTQAVTERLKHPHCHIFFVSFQLKEELAPYDGFGILSLPGIEFVRLPFYMEELNSLVGKYLEAPFVIPKADWEAFATHAGKSILKENISVLKHGNKLDFINSITGPLRIAALGSVTHPALLKVVRQQLTSVSSYMANDETMNLIILAKACSSLPDPFFKLVSTFILGLQNLKMYAAHQEIDIKQLIAEIDLLNETSSKMLTS